MDPLGEAGRIADLESRLRAVEDRLQILQLLAAYGPAADSRSGPRVAALWTADGSYDYGGPPLEGAEAIGTLVDLATHTDYVERGCAHVMGLPMLTVAGDRATATGYSRVYLRHEGGWHVERVSACRWDLVRTPDGWRVASRTNRLMDGSPAGPDLLRRSMEEADGAPQ